MGPTLADSKRPGLPGAAFWRLWGLGFGVLGLGSRVWVSGFRGLGFRG